MEDTYLRQYSNKSELEKLKVFLENTDAYSKLLLMGCTPKELLIVLEEPFLLNLTKPEMLDKMDKKEFNYQDEVIKYGLDIEYDALAYACAKLEIEVNGCENIKKSIRQMTKVD